MNSEEREVAFIDRKPSEKIVKCKKCHEKIMLHRRARGTYIAVEPEMILVGTTGPAGTIITEEGETIEGRPGDMGYIPHYLKCKGGR